MDAIVKKREVKSVDSELYSDLLDQNKSVFYRAAKRVFDFVAALGLSVLILIPFAIVALIVSLILLLYVWFRFKFSR